MSNHEAIPFCDGSGRIACVACSEEVDKCIPFPCAKVIMMITEYCGVCGESIVGGKGDYWHLIKGSWEMKGDDGHLAYPQGSKEFNCLEPNCQCDICGWWCSCGCNSPNGACSAASDVMLEACTPNKTECTCGCHKGFVKHCAPCSCLR